MKKPTAVAAVAASLLFGGGVGIALFGPSAANAQISTDSSSTSGSSGASTAPTSNEDPTHEAGESAQREADEDAGKVGPHGGHGSNEDPAHEATESPEREAQEDAANAGSSSAVTQAPSSSATVPATSGT